MKFALNRLSLEVTRKCNLCCKFCMRGKAEYVDLTPEIVDMILDSNRFKRIEELLFSGGEPTLNENIIIYCIDKIINEKLNVDKLSMVTNGQIFSRRLVEAFNRFNEYRNRYYFDMLDNHVRITFSVDRFHEKISNDVKNKYYKYAKGIEFTEFTVDDKEIYKTGFSTIGKEFEYKLNDVKYGSEGIDYYIFDYLYITANGFVTSEGMGKYSDMDNINMGHISETSIEEILVKYGTPIFGTPRISYSNSKKKTLKY